MTSNALINSVGYTYTVTVTCNFISRTGNVVFQRQEPGTRAGFDRAADGVKAGYAAVA